MAITESSSQQSDSKNQLVRNHPHYHSNSNNVNNNNAQQVNNVDPEPLDFDECYKDSPKFRQNLKENLNYVESLENCMSKTIKQITNYIDTGRDHIKSQQDFITSMRTLNASLGANNFDITKRINTLLGTLEEIMRLHEIVIDQSARTIGTSLSKFITDDFQKIKEARKSFDKISHEYDQALTRYSQPIKKQQDDSENILIATSTAFTHTSIDLSIQLTTLQSKKGFELLSSLLSFTRAYSTFFHQGFDLFEDFKPHISDMDEYLLSIQDEFEILTRSLPSKHLMVSNNELKPLCFDNKAQQVHLEGYLFKRASNGFKVWNRRWFILKDHQLLYQKRGEVQPTIMEEDLRLLTVRSVDRADTDRRFCFEVLSPHKSHILQADSEASHKTWIHAIQAGINAAFHDTEYKSLAQAPSATTTESNAGVSSSWGASFSFKALQQQATNRLNSIATLSESKSDLSNKTAHLSMEKIDIKVRSDTTQGSDDDENNEEDDDQAYKVDQQGRSYAPLKDEDEEDNQKNDKFETRSGHLTTSGTATYPQAAPESSKSQQQSQQQEAPVKPQRAYMIILAMPGNDVCADCGAQQPKWASINLGITLCIECAGIHRSLGVHLSKVRSLTLDTEVWSPEIVQLMLSLGNTSVNAAYMASYRGQVPQIDADSCREDRESWIKNKYLLKLFMKPPGADLNDTTEGDKLATLTSGMDRVNCEDLARKGNSEKETEIETGRSVENSSKLEERNDDKNR